MQNFTSLRFTDMCSCYVAEDDFRQHKFDPKYTAHENANMYGSLVGITGSNCFGDLDTQSILNALSKSKAFTNDEIRMLDTVKLTCQMRSSLFPQGYLV